MLVAPLPEQDSPRGRPRAVLTSAARYARNENAGSVAKRAVPAIRRAQTKGCLVLSACVCRVVKTSRVSCEGLRASGWEKKLQSCPCRDADGSSALA